MAKRKPVQPDMNGVDAELVTQFGSRPGLSVRTETNWSAVADVLDLVPPSPASPRKVSPELPIRRGTAPELSVWETK